MIGKVGFACKFMHEDQNLKPKQLKEIQQPLNFRGTTIKWLRENQSLSQEKVYEHWRNFDGGDFSHDTDGDWEYSDLYEVEKDEMDGFHVNWENGPQ